MNRASLLNRLSRSPRSSANRPESTYLRIEALEDRKLLSINYLVNDDWVNVNSPGTALQIGVLVSNLNDPVDPGAFSGLYGFDAFGTGSDGSSVTGANKIADAIGASVDGDTVQILSGTYQESDIVVNHKLQIFGAGNSGANETLIVPEVTSSHADPSNFGVGTHSGFILYSPSVTISDLRLDGNGNGALGGTLNYHQGITTLYDSQNGGDYSSLHNGPLAPYNFGGTHVNSNLVVERVTVSNTWWHGITFSGLSGQTIGQNSIFDSTVTDVGEAGSRDANRIGILLQNQDAGQAINSTITNVGVGIQSGILGPGTFGNSTDARNKSGMRANTVTDAEQIAYSVSFADGKIDLNFLLSPILQFVGFDNNKAIFTGANDAIGLYVNHSEPVVAGYVSTGAKIGMKIENTTYDGLLVPVLTAVTLTGPGTGVAGSVGILAENSVAEPNSASFGIGGTTTITGFATGVETRQNVAPGDSLPNVAQIDRADLTGNATAIRVGNNSRVEGNAKADTAGIVVESGGTFYPGFPKSYFAVSEVTDPPAFIGPFPDTVPSGNVTFNASSTYAPLLKDVTSNTTVFDFNNELNYPLGLLPPVPNNGTTSAPNGSAWPPNYVSQDGSGQLVIGPGGVNAPLVGLYGSANHPDPNNAGTYILDPIDISDASTINVVAKTGAGNQSTALIFGLVDITGNLALWTLPMTELNSSTYSTLTINLAGPGIPLSLGEDGNFDLSHVVGYAVLGDEGLLNGATFVPFELTLDEIFAGSVASSQLKVTGTVNLGGATLDGSVAAGF